MVPLIGATLLLFEFRWAAKSNRSMDFIEVSLVIVLAGGVAILTRLLKQPLIIGYMISGIIIGPLLFGFVQTNDTLDIFAHFGVSLLLFIVGLGLNLKTVREVGWPVVSLGLGQILLTTSLGWLIVKAFGYSDQVALLIGLSLAFSSTIVVLKLLSDRKEQNRLYGKVAIGCLLVQDVIAALLLIVAASFGAEGASLNIEDLAGLALKGLALIACLYLIVSQILPRIKLVLAESTELLFLFSLAWGLGVGYIFYATGFSLEIGALIAGVALAGQSYATAISVRLRPLRDFFLITFFVIIGAHLQLDGFGQLIGPALVLSAFVIIAKPLIIMLMMKAFGFSRATGFKAGLAMSQISEFSLIFIGAWAITAGEVVNLVTLVAWITIFGSSYLLIYSDRIYKHLEKYLTWFEPKTNRDRSPLAPPKLLLIGYTKGGDQFIKAFQALNKPYLVIDYNPRIIDQLEQNNIPHLCGDVTDLEILDEVVFDQVELIVLTLSDFKANALLIEHLSHQGSKSVVIICSANDPAQASQLYQLGASYVMLPHYIGNQQVLDFINQIGLNRQAFNRFRKHQLKILEALIKSSRPEPESGSAPAAG